jgi:exodeoxyribonuclease III
MIVATFNVNSIRSRLDAVLAWLERHAPDVLALQETKVTDDAFPADAMRAAGYHAVFRGEKAYNGVALLSRAQPRAVRFGFDDGGPEDGARLVAAQVGPVHVVNTYVPQGRDIEHALYRYKQEWFARLARYCDRHYTPRQRVVWVGDLNVAPEAIDIHNADRQTGHVCFHVAVRAAFARACAWGFEDVFRKHHPEAGQYTFFDYRTPNAAQRGMGWRIDHILATPPLARRSTRAWIDLNPRLQPRPSDHTVLAAEFDV